MMAVEQRDAVLTRREKECLRIVRNYLIKGHSPSIREIMQKMGYQSPRSVCIQIEGLIAKGFLKRNNRQLGLAESALTSQGSTVLVPVLNTDVEYVASMDLSACQLSLAVSDKLAPAPHTYYLVRATEDALAEQGLQTGDMALIQHQREPKTGETVLAWVDGHPRLRIWHPARNVIALKGCHGTPPILVSSDFKPTGVMVAILPKEILQ